MTTTTTEDTMTVRTIHTDDVTAIQEFQADRQHLTVALVGYIDPMEYTTRWAAAAYPTEAQAQAWVRKQESEAEFSNITISMTGIVPPQDQTPALPEALRRERFLAAVAARRAGRV